MFAGSPEGASPAPQEQSRSTFPDLDLYPTTEDWNALQGGRPRVFRNPRAPESAWMVVHVYEQHTDPRKRFQSGAIVDTLPRKDIELLRKGVEWHDEDGNLVQRDIKVPSFMDRNVHGGACSLRSFLMGGEDYDRVRNQPQYERLLESLRNRGWQELRFGVGKENFTLTPYAEIRPSTPLEEAA